MRQVIEKLNNTYCQTLGFEYMHITSRDECNWLRQLIESPKKEYSKEDKVVILDRLMWAELFEKFLAKKVGFLFFFSFILFKTSLF